ncbi:MAG: glycosyltransferase family 2 protein [Clostridia bacterium]|nr:glycosyltransferase family 2 protein [Clostridia bacterium]MBQ8766769.1 glycosyltransferase family 2 protein [Clostridia bacterium]
MKYSVIIPVYNSEKTIKRCIKSITSQDRTDVEIIIVNDGSTDKSESLCKALQTEHNNIIYIHKENGGVSSARNSGLSVAKGKYVMFVDSDDYVDSECFDMLDNYTKSDADFYQFVFSIVKNGIVKEVRAWPERSVNTLSEKEAFISESVVTRSINSCWARLYKRKIIEKKGLRFCEELSVGEDLTFVFTFLLSADKIERIDSNIYFVDVSNEESLSRRYRENLSEQLICVYESMCKALEKSDIESESVNRSLAWLHYRNAYSVANDLSKSNLSFLERRQKLKAMCSLFNRQKVTPTGFKCKIISIPIKVKLVGILDVTFQVINKLK